jgi:hypothetical protein
MRRGTLPQEEFEKRCLEVFDTQDGEEYYGIRIEDDGQIYIEMGETGTKEEQFRWVYFDYKPEMSGRSEALAYLMGERDDFND